MRKSILVLILFLTTFLAQATELIQMITTYQADYGALRRLYSNSLSDEYFSRIEKLNQGYLSDLGKVNYNSLAEDGKIDYVLFRNYLEKELAELAIEKASFDQVSGVLAFSKPLEEFYQGRRRAKKPEPQLLAASWNEVAKQVDAQLKNLASTPKYNSWHGSGIIGRPIGRDALEKQLAFEMIAYSPEELIAEAEKQFAWCEKEMLKASNELGFGDDWKAALEMVKEAYFPAGEWPAEVIRLAEEATDYVESNDLITVPPLAKETWRTVMISAERQRISPFFLGGESIQIAYPTSEMSHEDKMMSMRGNNPHFSRATVQHELIPGHHLQQFMNQRNMTHRRMFGTPFWTEGWALYWEFVLWDKDFPRDAKDKVGMLFWRMHRCARIIFSLNYHLEKMTPQECIDLLVDKVGHERANAEAEVRRSFEGNYGPLYQIAYMIGALEFYAMREEMVDSGKMTEKEYHDLVMSQNAMPVEILRAKVTGNPLKKDHQASWRFLD